MYKRLREGGYPEDVIPDWVIRKDPTTPATRTPTTATRTPEPSVTTAPTLTKDASGTGYPNNVQQSSGAPGASGTFDARRPVSADDYALLSQLDPEQLAERGLVRMPDGALGGVTRLQGGALRFDPLQVQNPEMTKWAERIAERVIEDQDITWRTIYRKVAQSPIVYMCDARALPFLSLQRNSPPLTLLHDPFLMLTQNTAKGDVFIKQSLPRRGRSSEFRTPTLLWKESRVVGTLE